MTTDITPREVGSSEGLGPLVEGSGLLECIDDAWQERGDWMPLVQAFADLVQTAERERIKARLLAMDDATDVHNYYAHAAWVLFERA